jgi:hypothetical protein
MELPAGNSNSWYTEYPFLFQDRRQGSAMGAQNRTTPAGNREQRSSVRAPRSEVYDDSGNGCAERDDLVDPEICTVFVEADKIDAKTK